MRLRARPDGRTWLRHRGAPLGAALLAACGGAPHAAPPAPVVTADQAAAATLLARFDSMRQALRIPGMAVVLLRDTTVIAAAGYGRANVARQVPVTPETPFDIASVAKPLSAVVALRLVEQGRLDLDRPMRRYAGFAEFCDAARADGGIFMGDLGCTTDRLTLRHVLGMAANGEPGTRFWYNPPAYSWASRPMAEVTGAPFSALVDSLVFAPAGMTHAARRHRRLPLPPAIEAALATPYQVGADGTPVPGGPAQPQGDGAAGGTIASAMDLARFDIALTTGRLLTPASRAALWRGTRTPAGTTLPYGLGWFLATRDGRALAWHTGLWEGRYSALYLKVLGDDPAERLTLVLLANSDGLTWPSRLDEAAIERSPFATAFLAAFPAGR